MVVLHECTMTLQLIQRWQMFCQKWIYKLPYLSSVKNSL